MTQPIEKLRQIMARLRNPETGCPWDIKQTFASIVPYTIEEAYEVLDAIQRNDMRDLKDELGDLLLQVVFHSRIAEEAGHFNFDDVANAISEKLERRHPHVFGEEGAITEEELHKSWNERKRAEKQKAGKGAEGTLADIPRTLPALIKASKIQDKAASAGFEWPDYHGAWNKVREELAELESAIATNKSDNIAEEIGDVLFSICNLARYFKVSPEISLNSTNQKFTNRFNEIETIIKSENKDISDKTLEELEILWEKTKS